MPLSLPVGGYNAIEHIVLNHSSELPDLLKSVLPQVTESNLNNVVNLIEEKAENIDWLADVKVSDTVRIPKNTMMRVKCKAKVMVDRLNAPVLFEPSTIGDFDDELKIQMSLARVSRGKSPHITIMIMNPTNPEILLKKGVIIGSAKQASAVVPLEFRPTDTKESVTVNQIGIEKNSEDKNDDWFRDLDLDYLQEEERSQAKQMFEKVKDVFTRSSNDIGSIENF